MPTGAVQRSLQIWFKVSRSGSLGHSVQMMQVALPEILTGRDEPDNPFSGLSSDHMFPA
jgi:hypothetical protein